ncbi:hypothetical protein SEA_XKCD426_37 [Streptomyces phage Xkcd426]|nr:hypothetical protein SEA_XKCD426_37 [Streptomyces phage Xkcd426]
MARVFDHDRPPAGLNPMQIAAMRAERLEDPIDRARFMDAFRSARIETVRKGDDGRVYHWYRAALDADHSATVAGLIEGAASVRGPKGLVF